jgi:TonB family protein
MAAKFEEGQNTRAPAGRSLAAAGRLSPSPGDTMPPTPLKELLTAGGANVFVLSADEELVDTVERAAGEHYPVFAVEEWAELEAAVRSGRCGIALLDADLLGVELARRIGELDALPMPVVVLVAADRPQAEGLMTFLSQRKIHRLLIKPPTPGITRLLLESAVKRCLQLRDATDEEAMPDRGSPPPRREARRVPLWIYAAAGAALIAGSALMVGVSSRWRTPADESARVIVATSPATQAPSAAAPAADPRFAELLARAELAFREGRLMAPAGDNALDYYLAVLAADPAEPVAREQLGAVVDALFGQAESALLAGSADDAAAALAGIRRADPASSRLQFLEAQIERMRIAAASPEQRRDSEPSGVRAEEEQEVSAAVARAAEVAAAERARAALRHAEWLAAAQQRLREGALLAPAGDSAQTYLTRLMFEAPAFPGLDVAWSDWRAAVVRAAEDELAARRWDAAGALAAALRDAPEGAALAASLEDQVAFGRRQEQYFATPVPAGELTLLERAEAEYPESAERRGVEGWVDLEFTVDTTGAVDDVVVTAAEPAGRFDAAAVEAVSRYRFAPFEEDGRRYARRARLRMRFALE